METITNYLLIFFSYAFAGWIIEVTLKLIQYHRFINRGFLAGPWLPIYGFGALLITAVSDVIPVTEMSYGTAFAVSFVLCGAVEYLTSFVLEKRFHARWWDYSTKPMNLHGRVWIGNLILFGLAGVAIMHISNPLIYRVLGHASLRFREVTASVLLAIFAADFVVTFFVMKLVKVGVDSSEADNTEEISKEVRQLLTNRSYFHKRFADAYPEVVYRTDRVQKRLAEIRAEAERIRMEAEKRRDERVEKVAASLEPAYRIRTDLIGKQEELIGLLYDEAAASDEMRELKAEIDRQKKRLESRPLVKSPYNRRKGQTR